MDKLTFMKLLDVSWADFSAQDPQCLGIGIVALYRGSDDELEVQTGANVPNEAFRYAVINLAARFMEEDLVADAPHAPRLKLKKIV